VSGWAVSRGRLRSAAAEGREGAALEDVPARKNPHRRYRHRARGHAEHQKRAGRAANVRAGDLVGAIVNETGVDARAIGAIQITDRFSLVEVPAEIADSIIETLRAATIKEERVPVRRDREQAWKS